MVYGRRRRFYRKPKRFYRGARRIKRYYRRRRSSVEVKHNEHDLAAEYPSIGNMWTHVDMTDIAQGTGNNQRLGNKITLTGYGIRGILEGGQTNTALDDNSNIVRLIVALWDSDTAMPLNDNSVTLGSTILKTSTFGKGLIKKLVDRTIDLRVYSLDSTGYLPASKQIRKYVRLNETIYYPGNAGRANKKLIVGLLSDSMAIPNPGFTHGNQTIYWKDS